MNIQGGGGDRAHEATAVLVREAFRAAADPQKYPDQIREGLRPWQPLKLYFTGGGGGRGGRASSNGPVARVDTNVFDPLLGRTYAEIGFDARSSHKCQGVGGVPPLPGGRGGGRGGGGGGGGGAYTLVDTTLAGGQDRNETSLFDGVDTALTGLARFAGTTPPPALTDALEAISAQAAQAREAFDAGRDADTAGPITAGLSDVRALRIRLGSMGLTDLARFEIDFRLGTTEKNYETALLAAHGLSFSAVADDGLVVEGQPVRVSIATVNHGTTGVQISGVTVAGFSAPASCAAGALDAGGTFACSATPTVPVDAPATEPYFTDDYWAQPSTHAINRFDPAVPFGVPFAATPFRAAFHVRIGSLEITHDEPLEYRYVEDVFFGDKRMELNVVPAFSVHVTPALAIFPVGGGAATRVERELDVSVTNGTKGEATVDVALQVPDGWVVTPARLALSFHQEDESLSARFVVTAPASLAGGDYTARAVVTSSAFGNERFSTGYQTIEYPHIERRQVIKVAETSMKAIDVEVAPNLRVGYIMGVGDQVPPAIAQLGAALTMIDTNELAWGDLSRYDVIVTGVRAYERRADLRAYNRRLLDYAVAGGTVIVQYNKTEFNDAQYGPYPAEVGRGRVADEHAPVRVLVPDDPVFTFPNRIGASAWANWTQERGLYFLADDKDPRYVDLVSMVDSFPDNPGVKLGALVEATVGRGRWLYVGLGLWRQLPAGTPGAYQILANLISLPKAPGS